MSRFIPRGVAVAGLGKRVVAAIIDALPVAAIAGAWLCVHLFVRATTVSFVGGIIALVLIAGYGLYQWWAYGSRAAGLGARAMGLQLVGINSGQPIGWWRFFLRQLVFAALMLTVVGGIALLLFTAIHERRQGWHDMAARSIVVQPKQQDSEAVRRASTRRSGGPTRVGLPPHLSSAFSPQIGSNEPDHTTWAPSEPSTNRPAWMPHIEAEPIINQTPQAGGPPGPATQAMPPPAYNQSVPPRPVAPQPAAPPNQPGQPPLGQPPQSQQPGQPPLRPPGAGPSPGPSRPGWIPLPTPSSIIEPNPNTPRVKPRQFGEVDDDDGGTRLVKVDGAAAPPARGGADGWYLRLDDGREVALNVTVLLGRNPQKGPGDGAVHLVPAGGDGRMISRTHVEIGIDARGVFVADRGSTNGTAIVQPSGGLQPCPTGTRVRVREGQQVSYGDRWFTLLRRPADS